MTHTLLFATHNTYKKLLFAPMFATHGLVCLTLSGVGLSHCRVPEHGRTVQENALLKARTYHSEQWPLVLGDDAGLEIDALNGEPGLQARRWNGLFADEVDDETWLAYLLRRLEGVPPAQRTARYVAAWAVITPDGQEYVRLFCRPILIAERPLRPMIPGSPMAAVEMPHEADIAQVRAEIDAEWTRWGMWSLLA